MVSVISKLKKEAYNEKGELKDDARIEFSNKDDQNYPGLLPKLLFAGKVNNKTNELELK